MNDHLNPFEPDPRLDALLDEALSSEGIELPAGMNDRIVAATMPLLAAQPAVVGRIGTSESYSGSFIMRIAAGLMVAASVGVAIIASNLRSGVEEADRLAVAKQTKDAAMVSIDEIQTARVADPIATDTFAMADTTIDRSLDLLHARADEVNAGVEQWSTVTESLENALNDMETEPDNG